MQTVEMKPSALKSVQLDHNNKLQQKYQQDIELLEDLRVFMRQRSVIEKIYAQSLCKLVQQFLVKRTFPTSESDAQSNKTLLEIWKTVLDETKNIATARLVAADTYNLQISEKCKQVRANRAQISKWVFEELSGLQKDISVSLQEMSKSQKTYRDEEHIAHDARVKAENLNNKVKNKSVGRFTSLAKLQQQSSKMNARVEACDVKSTAARNEYILNLRASNAQLNRYYTTDLPDLMQILDGEYFDAWKYFLTLFTTTDAACNSAVTQSLGRVNSDVNKISQQHNTECFVKENSVFTDILQYPYVPQDNDPINKISKECQADIDLEREARKWASRIAKENRTIHNQSKKVNSLKEVKNKAVTSSSEFLVGPTFAESELELEEERKKMRNAEIAKTKAEARMEALREGGVEVDVWINSASADVTEDEESTDSHTKMKSSTEQLANRDIGANANHKSDSSGAIGTVYPIWCVAVYDYLANNEDELTIQENENLEILGEGDGDGWVRGRNSHGVVGLIPANYIRVWSPVNDSGTVDVNEVNVDDGTLEPYAVNNRLMNVIEPQNRMEVPYAVNNPRMNVIHPGKHAENPIYSEVPKDIDHGEKWARALFDYEATCDEELSFQEGQLIRIISVEHDGVDDGWWRGEISGAVGVFPSLVVEELLPIQMMGNNVNAFEGRQSPQNPSKGVYAEIDNSCAPHQGVIPLKLSNNSQRPPEGASSQPQMASRKIQALFNDGTESAV